LPNRLLNKPRAQVVRDKPPHVANENRRTDSQRARNAAATIETIDWLAIWALSLAFSATLMAGLVYFTDNDTTGAAAILTGAAVIIAVALYAGAPSDTNASKPD
jgi:hypothetical protein